jgi:amino acid adenylation domain-containing protein/non-ribosomal peptide synthase protein (TIGR01720 family)
MSAETVEGFRLSPQQSRLWSLQAVSGAEAYRMACSVAIEGYADPARLRRCLEQIVARHEILRTSFRSLPGMNAPLQVVHERLPPRFEEAGEAFHPAASAVAGRRTDEEPVVTAVYRTLGAGRAILSLDLPALCADRATLERLLEELAMLYADGSLPDALQYADVAEWFNELLEKPESAPGVEYWRRIDLAGADSLALPFEAPGESATRFNPKSCPILFPASTLRHLEQLGQQTGATPRALLLTCWQVLLQRLSGEGTVVIGHATEGRGFEELQGVFGPCARYLPLRAEWEDDLPFRVALLRVVNALEEQEKLGNLFTRDSRPAAPDGSEAIPFFEFCFDYAERRSLRAGGLSLRLEEEWTCIDRFRVRLSCTRTEDALVGSLDYDASRIGAQDAERLATRFRRTLESALSRAECPVSALDILPEEERRLLEVEWNQTGHVFSDDRPVFERFEEAAARAPDAVAVSCKDLRLTYSELNERANRIAHLLRGAGVEPESPVALCVERSIEMVVGLLAIWKAGGAYVPIDPSLPAERLEFLVQDTGVALVLTRPALAERFAALPVRALFVDTEAGGPAGNPSHIASPENLAYVIFTSGSTGRPKGVAVEHRQVTNYVNGILDRMRPPRGAAFAMVTTLAADLGNTSIFPALATGSRLRVISEERSSDPEALAEDFAGEPVDYLKIVPSHLGALLSASRPERILPRRCLILGGEASSWELIERVRALAPSCEILNHYGPTEATIGATTFPLPATLRQPRPRTVPIGRPLPNCRVFLLDPRGRSVPLGVGGELCIGGAGVARGYRNRPDLTAEKFPVVEVGGTRERLYRTGDLARYLPDGNIELLGRTDDQVKLHGFRIEPGEIQAALRRHPAVQEAVVVPRELTGLGKRLVAYFVPRGDVVPASSDLRHFLAEKLPDFMVPSAFVRLKRVPLTANGKVDRAALPLPDLAAPGGDEPLVAPRTREEKVLSRVWADVLRVDRFSIHDNFFELGGDSILAIQIIARAAREGIRLTPRQLFERQTVAELAQVADTLATRETEQGPVTGSVPLTPIQHWFFEQELLDPHHFNQSMLLEAREALDPQALAAAIHALLTHHDALRLRFTRESAGWRQMSPPPEGGGILSVLSLRGLDQREQANMIARAGAGAHASLNLARGPLARALFFDRGGEKPARLLLVIHHLAVDAVSWGVLLEDLDAAYRQVRSGQPPALPPKTTAFRDWAQKLEEIAGSGSLEREAPYWLSQTNAPAAALPLDSEGDNTVGSARSVETVFSEDETTALLQDVPSVYRTQINDALLAALARAFAQSTGARSVRIGLEGHGREDLLPGIDLSRSVGWFTARFPVSLRLPDAAGPAETLLAVKEQLRAIPARGIGYGILRYLSAEGGAAGRMKALPEPDVSFNYLGQLDRLLQDDSLWRVLPSIGPERSARDRRRYALSVEGRVLRGCLRFSWNYSENLHRRATIERLAEHFEQELRLLITRSRAAERGSYTPSDFPKARMSQKDLEKLLEMLRPGDRDAQ